jgi:Domain of unknown function (DUF5658)
MADVPSVRALSASIPSIVPLVLPELRGVALQTANWLDRPRRVLLVLAVIWVLNAFDLCFTMIEAHGRHFRELNPLAEMLLHNPDALVAFKTSLVAIGSTILLTFRSRRIAELSCWFMLATYLYVGLRWWDYYEQLAFIQQDPAVDLTHLATCVIPR